MNLQTTIDFSREYGRFPEEITLKLPDMNGDGTPDALFMLYESYSEPYLRIMDMDKYTSLYAYTQPFSGDSFISGTGIYEADGKYYVYEYLIERKSKQAVLSAKLISFMCDPQTGEYACPSTEQVVDVEISISGFSPDNEKYKAALETINAFAQHSILICRCEGNMYTAGDGAELMPEVNCTLFDSVE